MFVLFGDFEICVEWVFDELTIKRKEKVTSERWNVKMHQADDQCLGIVSTCRYAPTSVLGMKVLLKQSICSIYFCQLVLLLKCMKNTVQDYGLMRCGTGLRVLRTTPPSLTIKSKVFWWGMFSVVSVTFRMFDLCFIRYF